MVVKFKANVVRQVVNRFVLYMLSPVREMLGPSNNNYCDTCVLVDEIQLNVTGIAETRYQRNDGRQYEKDGQSSAAAYVLREFGRSCFCHALYI